MRKLLLFEKRVAGFRASIHQGENVSKITKAAEKLRMAALALIKAKRSLINECPDRDPEGKQSKNLFDEENRWKVLSTEDMASEIEKM
jgi:hypothetical protein